MDWHRGRRHGSRTASRPLHHNLSVDTRCWIFASALEECDHILRQKPSTAGHQYRSRLVKQRGERLSQILFKSGRSRQTTTYLGPVNSEESHRGKGGIDKAAVAASSSHWAPNNENTSLVVVGVLKCRLTSEGPGLESDARPEPTGPCDRILTVCGHTPMNRARPAVD